MTSSGWSAQGPLFDTTTVVKNTPLDVETLLAGTDGLCLVGGDSEDATHCPLRMQAVPGLDTSTLGLHLGYLPENDESAPACSPGSVSAPS
ncbi:hypothetical protein SVIOM74S_09048 [Streptomyces violarus]